VTIRFVYAISPLVVFWNRASIYPFSRYSAPNIERLHAESSLRMRDIMCKI